MAKARCLIAFLTVLTACAASETPIHDDAEPDARMTVDFDVDEVTAFPGYEVEVEALMVTPPHVPSTLEATSTTEGVLASIGSESDDPKRAQIVVQLDPELKPGAYVVEVAFLAEGFTEASDAFALTVIEPK